MSRQVFGGTGQIETRFEKHIQDHAKLNSQLEIVKKSWDNATKASKIGISVPIFFSFLTFAVTFSHIIHRFKYFRPFALDSIPIGKSQDETRKLGRDKTGRMSRHNTTL